MNKKYANKHPLQGPLSFCNWKACIAGEPILEQYEFDLYSDARLTGEATKNFGPYQFFNLSVFPLYQGNICRVAVVRFARHFELHMDPEEKTATTLYHGGDCDDEIAALASLAMGCRIHAGGTSRSFPRGGQPEGHPVSESGNRKSVPSFVVRARDVLPNTFGECSFTEIEKLALYPKIKPDAAILLVRAARLYQNALWLAESQSHLSWLMLVSAVEATANWHYVEDTPLEQLRESKPELVTFLEGTKIPDLAKRVADDMAQSIGSQKKFVNFLMTYLPPPPPKRPTYTQIPWTDEKGWRKAFGTIYGQRSKALHVGIPFPLPVCEPPLKDWPIEIKWPEDAHPERPYALEGTVCLYEGNEWLSKDMPMYLHIFEYIVRHSLLKWWEESLATEA